MRWRSVRLVPFLQVEPVQQDAAARGLVEAGQQLDQRGFARAVLPHQGQALARPHVQIDARQRGRGGAGIDELDASKRMPSPGRGPASLPLAAADRLFQVLEEIRQIQIVFVQAADRRQRRAHRRLSLGETTSGTWSSGPRSWRRARFPRQSTRSRRTAWPCRAAQPKPQASRRKVRSRSSRYRRVNISR
jgi:hypothetical protein